MSPRFSDAMNGPACRAMFRAVIETAMSDGDDELILADHGEHQAHFEWLCAQADLDPDAVRRAYRARGHQKFALKLKDWAFLSNIRAGVAKTVAAREAGYKSKSAADKLLNRPDIVRVLQRFPHDLGEAIKIDAQ